jgi:hypothetical protein
VNVLKRRLEALIARHEEQPDKGFAGGPHERYVRCGRPLYTVLRVVYE